MAKLLMNILFLLLRLYPVSLHGNDLDRGKEEREQNVSHPLDTTRLPLLITASNDTINLSLITMSNTTTNNDNNTDATSTTNTTTNLLATNNTDTAATKSSTALATNSTNNTVDTTDSNATNDIDTNTKDTIATNINTTVTNTTANGTINSNTTVNATTTNTTTNITDRIVKLRNKTNTNSRRTMTDRPTTSTNATIIITAATNSRNIDATIATNSSTNTTSEISTTGTNNASNITNTDDDNNNNNNTAFNANNNTNVTTNSNTLTTSTNATSTNITKTISHTNRMECENEPIEANLTANETTECLSHILSEDYIKEKEGIYIERADVYRISKVYDPCIEGHRRIRPLIVVAVVVTLHSGHPFRLKGEQLVMRVYREEDECKLLFRRLTCVPPEWFLLLGRYASEPGKKFGQLVEWRKLVNEKHTTRPMKICDDEFERLVLPDVGSWGKPMFFKRSSENGH